MAQAGEDAKRGRAAYAARSWAAAHEHLARADSASALAAEDLELLATAAYMLGRDDEWAAALERAHHAHLAAGDALRAVRCAFWLSLNLALRGEAGRASGWLGRAQRLLEPVQEDCVERGYLLVPVAAGHEAAGAYDAAYRAAAEAAQIGARFGDADLVAVAVHAQGNALVRQGRVERGLALLDEAMVAVTGGRLGPIVTGLVYCSVIDGCQGVFDYRRAQEWTAALTRWCEQQPDMVAFTGRCLVHRAAIMHLHGAWDDALGEARRAHERCLRATSPLAAGEALYQQGEIHRLRGERDVAEAAYRQASAHGCEPQPGMALLRLAQGRRAAATAAIRRALGEATQPLRRAALLPAYVEILLAAGLVAQARAACRELEQLAQEYESRMLAAMAAHARGAADLPSDAAGALIALRGALAAWHELDAPYAAARTRALLGLACRALGDDDTAAIELEAARAAFEQLGARPDRDRVARLAGASATAARGLTPRQLEVLRMIAAGATNKAIAVELVISERTVDRHVSNIFAKLGVSSRAAATAYAYEHELVRATRRG